MQFKLFYFFFYMGVATLTYFNVYFTSIGLTSSQIGIINSVAKSIAFVILPLWGMIADYYRTNKKLLIICITGSIFFSLSFLFFQDYLIIILIMTSFSIFFNPIIPLADSQVLSYLKGNGEQYGKFRIWGSLGFTFTVPIWGYIVEQTLPKNVFFLIAAIYFVLIFIIAKSPESRGDLEINNFKNFKYIFKTKELFYFLLYSFFVVLTFSTNNIFFPVYMVDNGIGESFIGFALMFSAGSEMLIFYFSDKIISRFKNKHIFLVASLAFALRWLLIASMPVKIIFVTSQLLNSLSFGLLHISSINYINIISGDKFKATGQNLYATTKGISGIIGGLIGGFIYDYLGGNFLYYFLSLTSLIPGFIYYLYLSGKNVQVNQNKK